MEMINNLKHTSETFTYSLSRMLERSAYYGFRTVFVISFIQDKSRFLSEQEMMNILGYFITAFIFSKILGAILGDLILGSKKATIFGGILQILGIFSLFVANNYGLYTGLTLICLGNGLYATNIYAAFGKVYLDRTKLLDSGFSILYLAANIGSFCGVLFVSIIAEKFGWSIGFFVAGMLMLSSLLPLIFSKTRTKVAIEYQKETISVRFKKIIFFVLFVGIFWILYDICTNRFLNFQSDIHSLYNLTIPLSLWNVMSSYVSFPICIIAIIVWRYLYYSQFFKLNLGFLFATITFVCLASVNMFPAESQLFIYIISIFFLVLSEVHIMPIIHSTITKFSNPKHLAINISLAEFVLYGFPFLIGFFYFTDDFKFQWGFVFTGLITLGLILFIIFTKNSSVAKHPKN